MNSDVAIGQRTSEYTQADVIMQFLLDTKLDDLDNEYVKTLIASGDIVNPRNTIMAQIDLFYYNANYACGTNVTCQSMNTDFSKNILMNISEPILSQKYGYNYVIMDGITNYSVYNRSWETRDSSTFRVVTKRISYVKFNQTVAFKPHIVEFSLWTK
jgi:hypothetical protein